MFNFRGRRGVMRRRISPTCYEPAIWRALFFMKGKIQMKIVSIRNDLLKLYSKNTEVLTKSGRPCVLVARLNYRGKRYDFAIPFRSNIPANAPKGQYFPLPPRPSTRPRNRHGLHYIKMFPVSKEYLVKYRTEGNPSAILYKTIIDKNTKKIVNECQSYLDGYACGIHPPYSTDIDYLLSLLYPNK